MEAKEQRGESSYFPVAESNKCTQEKSLGQGEGYHDGIVIPRWRLRQRRNLRRPDALGIAPNLFRVKNEKLDVKNNK